MCRLAAFPPRYPRDKALEVLLEFEGANKDGVGSVHLKDGKFIVDKHATSISKLLKKGHPFLAHMGEDCNSWTLVHLRLASHGDVAPRNTHPFLIGDWAFIHNGVWTDYKYVRLALSKTVKFEGETDTEVAGHLWNIIGPKKFAEELNYGGVFMGLHKNGQLQVAKVSGDLEVFHRKNRQIILASELPNHYKRKFTSARGWFHYDKKGQYIAHKIREEYKSYSGSGYGTYFGHGHGGNEASGIYRPAVLKSGSGISGGCSGGSCSTPSTKGPVSPVFADDSDFARMGEDAEWQQQLNEELAEQLGLSAEDMEGIPEYKPKNPIGGTALLGMGAIHKELGDDENWHPSHDR